MARQTVSYEIQYAMRKPRKNADIKQTLRMLEWNRARMPCARVLYRCCTRNNCVNSDETRGALPTVGHIRDPSASLRPVAFVNGGVSDTRGKRALPQSIVKRSALYRSYIARNWYSSGRTDDVHNGTQGDARASCVLYARARRQMHARDERKVKQWRQL